MDKSQKLDIVRKKHDYFDKIKINLKIGYKVTRINRTSINEKYNWKLDIQ